MAEQYKNGVVTWKWLAGMLVAIIAGSGSVWVKVHTDIARVEERIKAIERQMMLERGLAERLDREMRDAQKAIITMAAQLETHKHGGE